MKDNNVTLQNRGSSKKRTKNINGETGTVYSAEAVEPRYARLKGKGEL